MPTAAIQSNQFARLANGTRLHYASAGAVGRPLMLFVHGFPEFWYEWQAQLGEFGSDHFAVAPDLRGFNLSDMPADLAAYKARHIVDDLRLLAAHLGYEKFVLVAHDWGGAIAWNLAIAWPQLLRQLVIINSPHPYLFMRALATDPAQKAASEYMNWLRAEGSEAALAKNDFGLLEGFFNGMGQPAATWFTARSARALSRLLVTWLAWRRQLLPRVAAASADLGACRTTATGPEPGRLSGRGADPRDLGRARRRPAGHPAGWVGATGSGSANRPHSRRQPLGNPRTTAAHQSIDSRVYPVAGRYPGGAGCQRAAAGFSGTGRMDQTYPVADMQRRLRPIRTLAPP